MNRLFTLSLLLGPLVTSACVLDEDEVDDGPAATDAADAFGPACSHYVSTALTASDRLGDGSLAAPWRTIGHAMSHVGPGARVCAQAGTYREHLVLTTPGTATQPITLSSAGTGEVVVDGTITAPDYGECPPTLLVAASHLRIQGLTITNRGNPGYPGTPTECTAPGLRISPGLNGTGTSDVIVSGNLFRDIAPARPDQLGVPLGVGSYQPGLAVHQIQILDNTFRRNDTIAEASALGLRIGAVAIVGDTHDFLVRGNVFDDPDTGGVELAGNQGNTLRPVRGVISNNQFLRSGSVGPFYNAAVYNQGGDYLLIERNFFDRTGIAVSIYTEPTAPGGTPCPFTPRPAGHTVVRDNVMVDSVFEEVRTGANDNGGVCNYGPVDSVYVTSNTIYRRQASPSAAILINRNPSAGLIGDNRVLDNIIITNGRLFELHGSVPLVSDYNYLVSPVSQPFYADQPVPWWIWRLGQDRNSRLDTALPGGIFAAAAPALRGDFRLVGGPPIDAGMVGSVTPSWAWFGTYTPSLEVDHFGGARDVGRRDVGADER